MDEKDAIIQVLLAQRNSFLEQLTNLQIQLAQKPQEKEPDGDQRID